jgi:hypothetical protein
VLDFVVQRKLYLREEKANEKGGGAAGDRES